MKIIDLLNKIANGEIKEGTKLKFANDTEICCFEGQTMTIDVNELNTEVEIIEEEPKGRWEPKEEGIAYFSINDWGVIFQTHYNNSPQDWFRILNKNVFKTDIEAREYLRYKEALLEAEKPFEYGEFNFAIECDASVKKPYLGWNTRAMSQGQIYLGQDQDVAQAFIDKWRKQILKYEFGIEE